MSAVGAAFVESGHRRRPPATRWKSCDRCPTMHFRDVLPVSSFVRPEPFFRPGLAASRCTARSEGQGRPLAAPRSGVALTAASTVRPLGASRARLSVCPMLRTRARDRRPNGLRRRKSAQPSPDEAESCYSNFTSERGDSDLTDTFERGDVPRASDRRPDGARREAARSSVARQGTSDACGRIDRFRKSATCEAFGRGGS